MIRGALGTPDANTRTVGGRLTAVFRERILAAIGLGVEDSNSEKSGYVGVRNSANAILSVTPNDCVLYRKTPKNKYGYDNLGMLGKA